VSNSIAFFLEAGKHARISYYWLGALQVGLSVVVPIFALLPGGSDWSKLAAAIAGSAAALAKGLDALWKTRETWLRCTSTAFRLSDERLLFQADAGKYAISTDKVALFAESVTTILEGESKDWIDTSMATPKTA
jgi:hypothetical protein